MLVLKPYIIMQKAHDQYIEGRRLPPSSFDQHALLLAGMRGGTKNLTLKSRELVQCTEFKMLHVQIKKCSKLIKKGAFKIETSGTQSQNHITRPNVLLWLICFIEYLSEQYLPHKLFDYRSKNLIFN